MFRIHSSILLIDVKTFSFYAAYAPPTHTHTLTPWFGQAALTQVLPDGISILIPLPHHRAKLGYWPVSTLLFPLCLRDQELVFTRIWTQV